jgi:hypothetical protein
MSIDCGQKIFFDCRIAVGKWLAQKRCYDGRLSVTITKSAQRPANLASITSDLGYHNLFRKMKRRVLFWYAARVRRTWPIYDP